MTDLTTSQPHNEQTFLKRNALLCTLLGMLLIFEALDIFANSNIAHGPLLDAFLIIGALALLVTLVVMLFKTLGTSYKISRQAYWFGNFQDEYINHINAMGYKYAFNTVCGALILCYGATRAEWLDTASSDIGLLCKMGLGIVFLSYSLPVLYLLRGDDE